VGLALGALPLRFGPRLRWRAATAAALVFSVPLVFTGSLAALYVTVTVLGAAYAPHLITAFALTERHVRPARLAEAMAFAASAVVAGQALALALSGRLAERYGPSGAFLVAVGAAALAHLLSLVTRMPGRGPEAEPEPKAPAAPSVPRQARRNPSGDYADR
jgi:MFS family permease